ncbi:Solute carrier family 2 facilitated glucose transporter member 2 [Trichostrongylus colubriformis]|uniref:Solute carrier family 2 facilitated glucose transporter member 2 n=1 Tax=Trichostrongylus colubriformis TaxID=6319 RepID=A0AAN8FUW9_TRICO
MATWTIQALSLALCLSSGFQQGYIASVLNQPYVQIQKFINDSWKYRSGHPMGSGSLDMLWSFLNICFPIAMIFGQFLAAFLCKRIGRRYTALLASALYIPATLLSAASKLCFPAFELLFVGRILCSIAILFMPWKARDPLSQVIRHGAWLGVMVKIAYVFTGARCIRAYTTFILYSMAGWSHKAALFESLMIGVARLPTTLIPVLLVDRVGRRPLLIISTTVCFISLGLMIVGIDIGPSWRVATLVGLTTVLLISACGIGSLSRFYAAELVPRSILLQSTSILTMFEALTKIGIEFAFYPLANVIHGQALLLFLIPTAIFTILMWMCPETSKRTVNEVMNDIAKRKKLDIVIPT